MAFVSFFKICNLLQFLFIFLNESHLIINILIIIFVSNFVFIIVYCFP